MIWNLETVHRVRHAYVRAAVDLYVADFAGAKEHARQLTGERLQLLGQDRMGVVLHMADVAWAEHPDMDRGQVILTAHWQPKTAAVEFHHGQRDGDVMILAPDLLHKRVRLTQLAAPSFVSMTPDAMPVPTEHLSYDWSGWNETSRRWIYTLAK